MTTSGTILIIDDEPNLRRSLALILQRAGHTVTTAADAQEALQNMQAGAFDLAFLDLKLPDRSGISLLPELRQLQPDMPILILTANATLETAIAAVRQGAVGRDESRHPAHELHDPDAVRRADRLGSRAGRGARKAGADPVALSSVGL